MVFGQPLSFSGLLAASLEMTCSDHLHESVGGGASLACVKDTDLPCVFAEMCGNYRGSPRLPELHPVYGACGIGTPEAAHQGREFHRTYSGRPQWFPGSSVQLPFFGE